MLPQRWFGKVYKGRNQIETFFRRTEQNYLRVHKKQGRMGPFARRNGTSGGPLGASGGPLRASGGPFGVSGGPIKGSGGLLVGSGGLRGLWRPTWSI